jgi:hypothetical protein
MSAAAAPLRANARGRQVTSVRVWCASVCECVSVRRRGPAVFERQRGQRPPRLSVKLGGSALKAWGFTCVVEPMKVYIVRFVTMTKCMKLY